MASCVAWKPSRASSTATMATSSGSTALRPRCRSPVDSRVLGGEADDLAERVDAGIGAAGGRDADLFARDLVPGRFDDALHRRLARLNLPPGVGRAVVGHGQFEPASGHGWIGDWSQTDADE